MPEYRLLVIEDDQKIADLVRRVAEGMHFETRSIDDFSKIPALYDAFQPHVIILDIVMPGMDGFEVLNFLYRRNSASRVIILSGQPDYRQMASRMGQGLELNITETLAKPFRIPTLRATLEKIKDSLANSTLNSHRNA